MDILGTEPNGDSKSFLQFLQGLVRMRIPGEARQVLDVIILMTWGSGCEHEWVTTGQFMELTGLSSSAVYKARRRLLAMNLITITRKRGGQVLIYSIQRDCGKWAPSTKK